MTRTINRGPGRKQMSDLRRAVKMTRSGSVAEYEALHNFAALWKYYGPPTQTSGVLQGIYSFLGG